MTCAYAHAFEKVQVIPALTLNCCPGAAAFEAACGRARNAGVGECLQCLSAHRDLSSCPATMRDGFCSGGH